MTVDAARPHQLQEPFSLKLPWRSLAAEMKAQLTFHFQGHYDEPSLNKELIIKKGVKSKNIILYPIPLFVLTLSIIQIWSLICC